LARGGAITDSELAHGGKKTEWVLPGEGEKKREKRGRGSEGEKKREKRGSGSRVKMEEEAGAEREEEFAGQRGKRVKAKRKSPKIEEKENILLSGEGKTVKKICVCHQQV